MNPFLKEECLQDYSTTEALIQDNDLIKVDTNVVKSNLKEEHQKELIKLSNTTSENFQQYLENELGQLDDTTATSSMAGVKPKLE